MQEIAKKYIERLKTETEDEHLQDAQKVAKAYIEKLKTGDIEEKFHFLKFSRNDEKYGKFLKNFTK